MSVYTLNAVSASHESSRLNFQHDILVRTTGTLLPIEITQHLSQTSSPKIADVATGTGVWCTAISKEHPNATIDGYDYDITKFPSQTASTDTTFSFADVLDLSTFPEEKVGTYDFVHVRLLLYGLKASEWNTAANNLTKLLKPGGWLLWAETGYPSWITLPPNETWYKILRNDVGFARKIGRDITWPVNLRNHVHDAGLQEIQEKDFHSLKLENQDDVKELLVRVFGQALNGIVEKGGYGDVKSKEDADSMVAELREELLGEGKESQMAGYEIKWVWGRKGE